MSVNENILRCGNFTSSQVYRLTGAPKPYDTYIKEKNIERKLGRTLGMDKGSRSTLWGSFVQHRVHELLPLSYEFLADITIQHPTIPYWVGTPDNVKRIEGVVGDTKCLEPKAFCEYVDVLQQGDTELFKKEHPDKYWQLISNACILGYNIIEAIVYMPYQSELPEIRELANTYVGLDFYKYRFIVEAPECELPYLPDNGHYKNLNVFRFDVPPADKQLLTNAILKAGTQLIERRFYDKEVNATIVS